MQKDIKKMMEGFEEQELDLSFNHRNKFKAKLQEEFVAKKKSYAWLYAAASIVVLLGLGIKFYPKNEIINLDKEDNIVPKEISLGTISPELKTVEAYYTNTINYELSQFDLTEENKELFDGYLTKIGELTKEYKTLTKELNTHGVNDNIINALIGNLQLRLQLLKRMQKQLKEIKEVNANQNEQII